MGKSGGYFLGKSAWGETTLQIGCRSTPWALTARHIVSERMVLHETAELGDTLQYKVNLKGAMGYFSGKCCRAGEAIVNAENWCESVSAPKTEMSSKVGGGGNAGSDGTPLGLESGRRGGAR